MKSMHKEYTFSDCNISFFFRHQIKDDVRQSFYEETNVWLKALRKKGTNFMGGDQPNLSDLAVYGVLTAVEGCEAFDDLRQNTKISQWFDRMTDTVKCHGGAILTQERGNVQRGPAFM